MRIRQPNEEEKNRKKIMKIDRKFNSLKSDYNSKGVMMLCFSEIAICTFHIDIFQSTTVFYHIRSCYIMRLCLCGMFKLQQNKKKKTTTTTIIIITALQIVKIERMKERLERMRVVVRINKLNLYRNTSTKQHSIDLLLCICVESTTSQSCD